MLRRPCVTYLLALIRERGEIEMKRTLWASATIAVFSWAACGTTPAGGGGSGDDDDDDTSCGDGMCSAGETKTSCPDDCDARCGDNKCTGDETLASCPQDCTVCGDKVCSSTEDLASCPADCAVCGDSICSSTESATSCAQDCLAALTVQNFSSFTISGLYVYACGTSSFGANQIAGRVISPNNTFTITHVPPGCWNFHADGTTGVFWDRFNTVLEAPRRSRGP